MHYIFFATKNALRYSSNFGDGNFSKFNILAFKTVAVFIVLHFIAGILAEYYVRHVIFSLEDVRIMP